MPQCDWQLPEPWMQRMTIHTITKSKPHTLNLAYVLFSRPSFWITPISRQTVPYLFSKHVTWPAHSSLRFNFVSLSFLAPTHNPQNWWKNVMHDLGFIQTSCEVCTVPALSMCCPASKSGEAHACSQILIKFLNRSWASIAAAVLAARTWQQTVYACHMQNSNSSCMCFIGKFSQQIYEYFSCEGSTNEKEEPYIGTTYILTEQKMNDKMTYVGH